MPLSPTFDTVGILARDIEALERSAEVLLGETVRDAKPGAIYLLTDALALADAEVQAALRPTVDCLRACFGDRVRATTLNELVNDTKAGDLNTWLNAYRFIQGAEALSCLGPWVEDAKPELGPSATAGLAFAKSFDRGRIGDVMHCRERCARLLERALKDSHMLCIPTAPTAAPRKGEASYDRGNDYYRRTLSLTSIAGVGRLPQVSIPCATASTVPVGLSLLAPRDRDSDLLRVAKVIDEALTER
jgi:amidase